MLEKEIEQKLVNYIKSKGGLCLKLNSTSMVGLPDRLVILPSRILFVELKAPKQKPRKVQIAVMNKLKALGCEVRVIDNLEQIESI